MGCQDQEGSTPNGLNPVNPIILKILIQMN